MVGKVILLYLLTAVAFVLADTASAPLQGQRFASNPTSEVDDFDPGIRFFLMKHGLDYFIRGMRHRALESFNNLNIPAMYFSASGLELTLKDFVMDKFNYLEDSTLEPAYYVNVELTDLTIHATSEYEFHDCCFFNDSGILEIITKEGSMSMRVRVDEDPDAQGHLRVFIESHHFNLGKLQFNMENDNTTVIEQFIDIFVPLIEEMIEDSIGNSVIDMFQKLLDQFLSLMPVTHVWDEYTTLVYLLVPEKAQHQAEGAYYGQNDFDHYDHEIAANGHDLADYDIANYRSVELIGYINPTIDSTYRFLVEYEQRIWVEINNNQIHDEDGDLEWSNPGMCWPQNHDFTLGDVQLGPSYDPLELHIMYQSGCGGGWFKIHMMDINKGEWEEMPSLWLYDRKGEFAEDEPVVIDNENPEPGYIAIASTFTWIPTVGRPNALTAHNLPTSPKTSLDMFHLAIDENSFTSFYQSHVAAGVLDDFFITPQTRPNLSTYLSVYFWARLFPGLDQLFDPSTPLGFQLYANDRHVGYNISESGGLRSYGEYTLMFYTLDPKTFALKNAVFDVSQSMNIAMNVIFHQGYNATLEVKHAFVETNNIAGKGVFPGVSTADPEVFATYADIMDYIANDSLLPLFNEYLPLVYPFPVPEGYGIGSANLQMDNHFIYMIANLISPYDDEDNNE